MQKGKKRLLLLTNEKAVKYYRRILSIKESHGEIWGALGHCYLMMEQWEDAYAAYQQALCHLPDPKVIRYS